MIYTVFYLQITKTLNFFPSLPLNSIKMKTILLSLIFLLTAFLTLNSQVFNGPESVAYDGAHGRWLVANKGAVKKLMNYYPQTPLISDFSTATLASAPYGLEIVGNVAYSCQGGNVRGYDLDTRAQVFEVILNGGFLNGICSDGGNFLFVSDFNAKIIYRISINDSNYNLMRGGLVESPNGMYYDGPGNRIVFVNWGANAKVKALSLADSTVTTLITTSLTSFDGITRDLAGNWYISTWGTNSLIRFDANFTAPSQSTVMTGLSSPADIEINTAGDSIAIPNSGSANTVVFYTICSAANVVGNFGFSINGNTVTFSDSSQNNPTGHSWDFGDGGTSSQQNPVHIYTATGIYYVCLAVAGDCGSLDTICDSVNVTVVANSPEVNEKIYSLAPNPANDLIHLSNESQAPVQFSLLDLAGKTILQTEILPGSVTELNISTLPSGLYLSLWKNEAGDMIHSGRVRKL